MHRDLQRRKARQREVVAGFNHALCLEANR
jgi:hypothetical protein